jgi:hypothetical protein
MGPGLNSSVNVSRTEHWFAVTDRSRAESAEIAESAGDLRGKAAMAETKGPDQNVF